MAAPSGTGHRGWGWRLVSWICTIQLVLSCAAVLAVLSFNATLRVLGDESFTVLSGSMSPTIPVGALVVTHAERAAAVRVGDVITFHPPGDPIYVTHRVAVVADQAGTPVFVTKGDANPVPDRWRLLGVGTFQVVVADVPEAGYISSALQTTTARFALIFIPGVLLCAVLLIEIWRPRQTPTLATSGGARAGSSASPPGLRLGLVEVAALSPSVALALLGALLLLQPFLSLYLSLQIAVGALALAAGVVLAYATWRHGTTVMAPHAASPAGSRNGHRPTNGSLRGDQVEMLRLVARGMDPLTIAERLAMSPERVRLELSEARAELESQSDLEAALRAGQQGLL